MSILTKNQLSASNQANFPDNTTGAITPLNVRSFNQDVIDTLVDSLNTGSYALTTESNDFTQANSFTSISASSFVSASAFTGDGSRLTNITASIALPILDEGVLQGYATSMNFTGSAISAQVIAGTAVVQVNIDNVGLVTTASFNAYTQSTNAFTASTNQFTQSVNTSITNLNASSASQQVSINALNVYTASQDSSSIVNSITELNTFSASAKIELVNLNTSVTNLNSFSSSTNSSINQLNASTASQQISINALNSFSSSTNSSITQLNSSTASQQISINALNTFSASALVSISNLNSTTASLNTSVTNINSATASLFTSASLALVTASFDTGTRNLTFTKGDTNTFSVNIPDVSGSTINTGSFATTASFNSYTQSNDQRVSSLEAATSSYVTESETGSFARYDVSNPWSANQTFTNITAVSASFTYVQTTYETASVIYSSGSNQFGDELSDIQTLSGSVKVQGSLTVNGTPVLTSSVDISGLTTTASFNAYTQSANQRIGSLETATASLFTSTSLSLTTASFDNGTRNLTFTKGDNQTFSVNIPDVSGSTLPSGVISGSAQITALGFVSSSVTASSLVTASFSGNTLTFTKGDASTFGIVLPDVSGSTIDTGSFVTTSSFNAYTSSQSTASLVTSITELNTFSSSTLLRLTSIESTTSSLNISVSNLNTATASLFTSASLGLTTASFSGNTLTFRKGDGTTFGIVLPDVSGSSGTFATLGANTFTGSQTISSSLNVSGSANFVGGDVNFTDQGRNINIDVDRTIIKGQKPTLISSSLDVSGSFTASLANGFTYVGNGSNRTTLVATSSFTTNVSNLATTGSNAFFGTNTFSGAVAFTGSAPTILSSSFSGSIITNLTDTYTDVAAVNQIVTLTSASYAALASGSLTNPNTLYIVSGSTSGSITGATLGSNTFSGSQIFTGSVQGNVVAMSITSNTASMDLSRGNYFTLTLADTATTHISASNVQPGVSATLVITTGTNSSASLAPTMLQPSGSAYSATNGSAKKDVLSIVAVASGVPFVVSTKNMI